MEKICLDKSVKFWNKRAKGYDGGKDASAFKPGINVSKTKEHLKGNETLLDYGCATGTFVTLIADSVDNVIGIDISPKMIELAEHKKNELKIENINFKAASIFDENFEENSFDVITAFNVFHLLEDVPKVIGRLKVLLKQGGLLISSTPCMGEKLYLKPLFIILGITGIVPHLKTFKSQELNEIISDSGFEIVEQTNVGSGGLNSFIICKRKNIK